MTAGIKKERDPRAGVEEPAKAPKAGKLQASSESNWQPDVRNEKIWKETKWEASAMWPRTL